MRKILTLIVASIFALQMTAHSGPNHVHSDIFKTMKDGDKLAIMMVHFGTTHEDTRILTIDAINSKVAQEYPMAKVCEAYTSRIIIKRLNDKGIKKDNPQTVLKQLAKEGYTHILIQSSTITDGVEMESLYKDVDKVKGSFKEIRIGDPLLYSDHDYEDLIEVLANKDDQQTAYVWVGHGTYKATTAQYAMMDYMLKAKGYSNYFVGTIEGYPSFDDMLNQLKASKLKKVVLVPLMFVAGEHAKNDIAEDWKQDLEKAGFGVEVFLEGLGQNSKVQDLYLKHLTFITKHRKYEIMEKKAIYEKTGEKIE